MRTEQAAACKMCVYGIPFSCLLALWRLAAGVLSWWLAPNFVACKVVSVYRVVCGVSIWPLVLGGCSCVDAVRCGCLSRVKRCVCVLSRCVRADASLSFGPWEFDVSRNVRA